MQDQPETIDQPTEPGAELSAQSPYNLSEPFSWQAPEGTQVHRGTGWYIAFGVVLVILMALAIVVFKSLTFAVLLLVMAIAVIMLSTKPPRIINYSVSPKGIYIEDKLHDYSEFRAFSIFHDTELPSVILLPVKRFSPGLTLYFGVDQGERVIDMLGARLPVVESKPDMLEKLIRLMRL